MLGNPPEHIVPVGMLWPLVHGPPVHGDSLDPRGHESIAQPQRLLQISQHPDLAGHGYAQALDQGLQDPGCLVGLLEQGGSHAAQDRETLGAAHVDVDAGDVVLHELGHLEGTARVAGAQLQDHPVALPGAGAEDYRAVRPVDVVHRPEDLCQGERKGLIERLVNILYFCVQFEDETLIVTIESEKLFWDLSRNNYTKYCRFYYIDGLMEKLHN